MILHLSFEEISSLSAGARRLLTRVESGAPVAAPPEAGAEIERLLQLLGGDLSLSTLAEAQRLDQVVSLVLEELRSAMEARIVEQHAGAEDAVAAYFDFGHVLSVLHRLRRVEAEMSAMIEMMTGRPPTPEAARQITFPD